MSGRRGTSAGRHQSLRAIIDWSYELLDHEQRRGFAQLSVFQGGWTLEAAQTLLDSARSSVAAFATLRALVDKCLVEPIETDGRNTRYAMLETIKAYALGCLSRSGDDLDRARRVHSEYFADLAERAAPHLSGDDQLEWLDMLEADDANLRLAIDNSLKDDRAAALRLVIALKEYWFRRGHASTVLNDVRVVCASLTSETLQHSDALRCLGQMEWTVGNFPAAGDAFERAFSIVQKCHDAERTAALYGDRAWVAHAQGRDDADRLASCALELAYEVGKDELISSSESAAGSAYTRSRGLRVSMMHYEQAMRAAERAGDHRCRATSLLNIGLTELELPDPDLDRVMTYAHQSKEIFEQIKEPHGATYAVHAIGLAYAGRGETAAAVAHFRETLRSAYRLGDLTLAARTLLNIAQHRAHADPILAAEAIGHSDTLFRTLQTFVQSELTASRAAAITQSRNALGDEAFEHHHHIGAALTTHLAVARTLERTDDSLDG